MALHWNKDACYACETCRLICSYHHEGSYWPEKSSIRVSRNPQTGIIRWAVDDSCDGCGGESEPLCVKYCMYNALEMTDV